MPRFGARAAGLAMLGAVAVAGLAMSAVEAQGLQGPTWRAEAIMGSAADKAASTIRIADDGRVSGSGGCNRIMGSATITGGNIAFGGMGSTRMACAQPVMEQERNFLEALSAARSFRIADGRLTLLDAAGAERVRFARER